MAIFRFSITTDANTTKANKKETVLKLTGGVIHQISISFPSGPLGLLHLQIVDGLFQVWPTNPDENFAWENVNISFKEFYELNQSPYRLSAFTWNEDDTYAHEVIIRIGVLPLLVVAPSLSAIRPRRGIFRR